MPWIKVIQKNEAEGELKDAYDEMQAINDVYGSSPPMDGPHPVNPIELSSLNPLALLYGRQFMVHVMRGDSGVTAAQREMIATVTSLAASCRY